MIDRPLRRAEWLLVLAGCAGASLAAIAWSWHHNALLNYGDAVAHLHIARRVLDGRHTGLSQLGSVWLPLPHLLMLPLVAHLAWWANGLAGLIPSALAYLLSCAGLYRLERKWLSPAPAALGLAFFALNPNLLYLQTTAMTEPLFLCEMIWLSVWLVEWRQSIDAPASSARSPRLLFAIALTLAAAVFTRYDGWIMALLAWTAIGIVLLRRGRLRSPAFWIASAIVVGAPIIWFAYNAFVFGDWLDFMRGPYSAAAIEARTATPGSGPPHPGWHNMLMSLEFFVKAAEMDSSPEAWGNRLLLLSMLGTAWAWLAQRRRAFVWSLLLWLPLPFYAYSVAYSSVPIFLPVWWPHSYYNTRYGMEMLPAFSLGLAFAAGFLLLAIEEYAPKLRTAAVLAFFALIGTNAWLVLRDRPLVYVEGTKNIASRRLYDREIPPELKALIAYRPQADILMVTSVHPELLAFSGIPLRRTINEADQQEYQRALAAPATHAAIVLALDGDDVDRAVKAHPQGLRKVLRVSPPNEPAATIYVAHTPPGSARP